MPPKEEDPEQTPGLDEGATDKDNKEPTVEIEGQQVPISQVKQVMEDYKNDKEWKRANDQRSTELKEERRRLEEERAAIEAEREEIEKLREQPRMPVDENIPDLIEDPNGYARYVETKASKKVEARLKELDKREEEWEKKRRQADLAQYHAGLETQFLSQHPEFRGEENRLKFEQFVERAAKRSGALPDGRYPPNILDDQFEREQRFDPEKERERIRKEEEEKLVKKYRINRSRFETDVRPGTNEPPPKDLPKMSYDEILNRYPPPDLD